jgi:hypothetical protein
MLPASWPYTKIGEKIISKKREDLVNPALKNRLEPWEKSGHTKTSPKLFSSVS